MPSERKIIEDFLTTDNKPIPAHVIVQASHVNGHRDFYNKPLFMSEWLDKTYLHTNDKYIEYAKLIPRVFEALSTCMKTRGTISHFETEF